MKLSEIKSVLTEGHMQLTKSLGQNFLHDTNQLHRIVASAELSNHDPVLEIGPGLGPLTELLLPRSKEVLAIEKDRRLAEFLKDRLANAKNLKVVHDDALQFLRRQTVDWSDWKMVSNLPYSVASRILVELAVSAQPPKRIVVTLQLEVIRRLVSAADEPDYGMLTLLIQLCYESWGYFKIPAACFFPEPKVDSGCVTLVRRPAPLLGWEQTQTFISILKRSFSQRRKMMWKLLKQDWPIEQLESAFEEARLSPQLRAEAVNLRQFVILTKTLHRSKSK
jgi:16S rRNA (adenine1518-N6/adenine1519-N6)-dimethyltransferase